MLSIMKIKFITCSGTNEHTDIQGLVNLLSTYQQAEAGIQIWEDKCAAHMPRYHWIKELHAYLNDKKQIVNLAAHINRGWVEGFCAGNLAPELEEILNLQDYQGNKFIKRLQLNFKIGREKKPDINRLIDTIKRFPKQRVILSYNSSNAELINQIYSQGIMFDVLFDASFGAGIMPKEREKAAFSDRLQGYAGGLGPDNIADELAKISAVTPKNAEIYIDAQGRLEDDNQHLSLEKCHAYISNALTWQTQNI